VKLTILPFVIKAVTDALVRHPVLNSSIDEQTNELVYKKYYDIGVATATDAGLVVPVIRDADRLRLFEVAEQIDQLAQAARRGALRPEDLRDSTFTVTSLGKQGGLLATPILNYPEVAILGVHRIKDKPVVRDGRIVPGKVMLLSLSFDHRVVDGHVGAAFAYDVIATLENPEHLFYELL
jgi:pyruvate dehydrogenase E2 component (dihydrolipoamide acetyltransferase)